MAVLVTDLEILLNDIGLDCVGLRAKLGIFVEWITVREVGKGLLESFNEFVVNICVNIAIMINETQFSFALDSKSLQSRVGHADLARVPCNREGASGDGGSARYQKINDFGSNTVLAASL